MNSPEISSLPDYTTNWSRNIQTPNVFTSIITSTGVTVVSLDLSRHRLLESPNGGAYKGRENQRAASTRRSWRTSNGNKDVRKSGQKRDTRNGEDNDQY